MLFSATPDPVCSPDTSTSIFIDGFESIPPEAVTKDRGEKEKSSVPLSPGFNSASAFTPALVPSDCICR